MNSLDILTTFPCFFYKKLTGTRNYNLNFDIGDESIKLEAEEFYYI